MNIALIDIVQAYRKAKVDTWLRHDIDVDAYFKFERKFEENIRKFLDFINRPIEEVDYTTEWLGGWRLAAKKIAFQPQAEDVQLAEETNAWRGPQTKDIDYVSYRLMAQPTVNFQILSGLWINRVGWKYDAKLGNEIYGNRLRLQNKDYQTLKGSFQCYWKKFSQWKQEGINALQELLQKQKAIAVTADANAFFHSISPDFLLDDEFLVRHNIQLDNDEKELTRHLIKAINAWAAATPLKYGLPVGLIASGVIANAVLLDLDQRFTDMDVVRFYGRYVDDLMLVLEDNGKLKTGSAIWEWIAGDNKYLKAKDNPGGIVFSGYSKCQGDNRKIVFAGDKCKIFRLGKNNGRSLIEVLKEQMRENTSEFRYLPRTVFNEKAIESKVMNILAEDGEKADNFRKISTLILRRGEMKMLLREMDFLLENLPPECWKKQRNEFYKVVKKYLITVQKFVDYAESDVPKIVSLATQCGDFRQLGVLLSATDKLCNKLTKISDARLSGGISETDYSMDTVSAWRDEIFGRYARGIKCSYNASAGDQYDAQYERFVAKYAKLFPTRLPTAERARVWVSVLAFHDLAATSVVKCICHEGIRPYIVTCARQKGIDEGCVVYSDRLAQFFGEDYLTNARKLANFALAPFKSKTDNIPWGFLFPTRPISEVDLLCIGDGSDWADSGTVFKALRGYGLKKEELISDDVNVDVVVKKVAHTKRLEPVIAIMNLSTDDEMCYDEITQPPPREFYRRFRNIIEGFNSIIEKGRSVDYIVLHELALPLRWFISLATHCSHYNISIISGITYRNVGFDKKSCKNEVWCSLMSGANGFFRPILFKEEKGLFAREEAYNLEKEKGYTQDTTLPAKDKGHAVFLHGSLAFSILICSELMDIANRARLVGLIDALFILAWNKDVGTFGSIVESSAIDLHAYVVQVNNNKYGDSRVRTPGKESWMRDAIRLRGGLGVYSVMAKLDVRALRKFQQSWDPSIYFDKARHDMAAKEMRKFKPMPPAYKMAEYRKDNG